MHKTPYNLQAWQRTRRQFLSEHPLCVHCAVAGLRVPAHHVDHVQPVSEGGAWFDVENLQGLCAACHSVKTRGENGCKPREFIPGCDSAGRPVDQRHPWNKQER